MGEFFKKASKGLITLLPIIILIWLFNVVYTWFEGLFYYVFGIVDNNLYVTLLIFAVSMAFLYYLGHLIEKNREFILLKITELAINRIPVVKSVYSVIKDVVGLFSKSKEDSYLGVCYVRLGSSKLIGFITKKNGNEITVFVPTTPNPTTGLLLFMDENEVEMTDMDVKEGFQKIMSIGLK